MILIKNWKVIMQEDKKTRLLKGLDEYYKRRNIMVNESTEETVTIGNITAIKINCSFEEYAKSKGLINVRDVQRIK